ncbi:hypothetical protein SPRG_02582 [Saprolegnia parasitica CBS 223.65]|uniref:Uncharacterized protein n=1 Tax=Saprolegnia parasitica (strain CBS 223.65) TaxID=695850 RepID=A0A067D2B2_SAPPC|nr:hypothetical protein SPRG_02582 [Saprolegnia parasitica CBS 223.65]KDO32891.1 hypothetical protein SPRG_02582 [Saprolegnia parasitica CBS 223.65]|eukprot:XP_012196541.1 hypothetical protein SPRG_02582 [Saprolegnia parasitica CBS 223.65]
MHNVAAHVLCSSRLLPRICSYQSDALSADGPLRCRSVRLAAIYGDEQQADDDHEAADAANFQRWLARHGTATLPFLCVPHLFAYALRCGDVHALQWLVHREVVFWNKATLVLHAVGCHACPCATEQLGPAMAIRASDCVRRAATKGHVGLLRFLFACGFDMVDVWRAVCSGGHLDVARFVVEHRLGGWTNALVNVAAENGHFELVRYFNTLRVDGVNSHTLALAVRHGDLQTVQALLTHPHLEELSLKTALSDAIQYRRLELVQWLCQQPDAPAVQCLRGELSKVLRQQRISSVLLSKELLGLVTSYQPGHDMHTIGLRQLCHRHAIYETTPHQVPEMASYAAYHSLFTAWWARHGKRDLHLLCLPHLFAYAITYGNTEVIRWLSPRLAPSQRLELLCETAHRCVLSTHQLVGHSVVYADCVAYAAESGHVELLKFLDGLGFTMEKVWHRCSYFGHVNVARYAHAHELDGHLPRYVYDATLGGHVAVVQFYHEHGYPGFTEKTIWAAVHSGRVDMVAFVLTHRDEASVREALLTAVETDHVDILKWLCNRPGADRMLDTALQQACLMQSHACIAYLVDELRVTASRTATRLYKRYLQHPT